MIGKWLNRHWKLYRAWSEVRDFPWNVRRTWQMVKVYWGTCDCDWSSIAIVMRHQIGRVRKHIKENDIIQDADKVCQQMQKCEVLLTRLLDETYYEEADKQFPERGRAWAKRIQELGEQDMQMLTDELRRHLRNWWD